MMGANVTGGGTGGKDLLPGRHPAPTPALLLGSCSPYVQASKVLSSLPFLGLDSPGMSFSNILTRETLSSPGTSSVPMPGPGAMGSYIIRLSPLTKMTLERS